METPIPYRFLEYQPSAGGGPLATVTLDRPDAGNRINADLAAELRQVCQVIREDDRIHLVILTGRGTSFSVGREVLPVGLAAGPLEGKLAWLRQLQVASCLAALEVPVIVALNGDAMDHGLELALAGDLRIASASSRFGLTDLARAPMGSGFPWDGGTQRLPRLVGLAWAQDMVLTSRILDSAQALDLGLVNRVVAAGQLMVEASRWADSILAGGPIAARYAKEAMRKGMDLSLPQGLALEADLNVILQSTSDRAEGIQAFLQRRAPRFTGG